MIVIPAIDIKDGECVRLVQGDFDQQTVYGDDPLAMAKHWEAEGAQMLHVVDLDGAKDGSERNRKVIQSIATKLAIPVQVGGGIRTPGDANDLIVFCVSRVIIGTMAFEDRDLLQESLKDFGPKIVVAIETKNGKLVTHGWQNEVAGGLIETAKELEAIGVQRLLYTDVGRDGMLGEPNYSDLEALVNSVNIPIIASGGVSSVEAVQKLDALGVEGAIVGKALYEGKVTLQELNDAC